MNESIKILSITEFTPATNLHIKFLNGAGSRMMNCFSDFCLWFSLPLSIWLSMGWVGLIFCWQAIPVAACRMERMPSEDRLTIRRRVRL